MLNLCCGIGRDIEGLEDVFRSLEKVTYVEKEQKFLDAVVEGINSGRLPDGDVVCSDILDYRPPDASVFMFTARSHSLVFSTRENDTGSGEERVMRPPNVKLRHDEEKKQRFRREKLLRLLKRTKGSLQKVPSTEQHCRSKSKFYWR